MPFELDATIPPRTCNAGRARWLLRAAVCSLLLMHAANGFAVDSQEEAAGKPLFELGAGVGAVVYPNYRGSREYNVLGAPVPLVIYRGDYFKVSGDGARLELLDHPRLELDISGGGSLPVDSDDDPLRRGLPDLDPAIEFGPKLSWLFSDPARRADYSLRLHLPVRGVLATDLSDYETIGFLFEPELRWRQRWPVPGRDHEWSYSLRAGPLFATGEYHEYFYSVAPRFATGARPAFDADGGYSGFSATGGIYHRRGRLRMGAVLSVDSLHGATFEDSPLVATNQAYRAGVVVSWSFWQSEERAPEPLDE